MVYMENTVEVQWIYICTMACVFAQGRVPVMCKACVPVFIVTLLIAVSSYEVYIYIYINIYIYIYIIVSC